MKKTVFLGVLFFLVTFLAQSQTVILTVNDDVVKDNDLYEFFPRQMFLELVKNDKHYSVSKGKITLARGKNIVMTAAIDTGYIVKQFMPFMSKVKGGDKILLDINEITELVEHTDTLHYVREIHDSVGVQSIDSVYFVKKYSKHKINFQKYIFFTLKNTISMKVDPNCTLLLNNNQDYSIYGIAAEDVQRFLFTLGPELKNEPVTVSVLRDNKMSSLNFKNATDLTNKYKTVFKFSLPNDVLLFEVKKVGQRSCAVSVPIK